MAKEQIAPPPRPGRAALVWVAILIVISVLLLYRGMNPGKVVTFTQSEFSTRLEAGDIITAAVSYETDRVMNITGTCYSHPAAANPSSGGAATTAVVVGERVEQHYVTRAVYSEKFNELLYEKTAVKVESSKDPWWTILLNLLPMILLVAIIYFFISRQIRNAGRGAMDFGKSKARMIPPDELHTKFEDIAGADEAKEEIQEIVEFLKDPLKFQLLGGRIPKGCLLVGAPGTGKTLLAKAVACEAGVPFFSISGSDFVEMFVGVGASRVRDMFEQARKNTPALIFIDEIDAVGRSRFSGWGGGHDEREQTLNAMLVEMDGLESRCGVIVLAATNRPDVLDPALLRPGRFDRQVVMDLPDIAGRRKILDVHAKNIKLSPDVDLDTVARTTPGFSGADLANLCNEAALLAARYNREMVVQADMEEARDKVRYGRERRSRRIIERERRLTAYHEAGHTLVALHSEHAVPVHKVTIIPRGQSYLGATFMMPKEDTYTRSKLEILDDMAMSMGGRAAEELVFGDITTGAVGDIEHLTQTAKAMVCIYGMTSLGPIKYMDMRDHPHVRIDMAPQDAVSPETAREIDMAIRELVNQAHDRALTILREHRDQLEKLAMELLEKETLALEEIQQLLGMATPEIEVAAADAVAGGNVMDEHGNPDRGD
jgi:cell division protease FtsH